MVYAIYALQHVISSDQLEKWWHFSGKHVYKLGMFMTWHTSKCTRTRRITHKHTVTYCILRPAWRWRSTLRRWRWPLRPQLHFQTLETSRAKSRNSLVEDSDYERWLLNVVLFKAEKLLWEFSSTRSFQSCGVPSSKGVEPPRGWPSRVTNPNGLGLGFVYRNSSLGVLEIYRRSSMSMENSKDQKVKNHPFYKKA